MTYVEVAAIIATDDPMTAYGGIRLTRPALEKVAEALKNGKLRPGWHHDPRIPATFTVIDSGLRETPEGGLQVWATLRVERSEWDEFQSGLPDGALGGMSITFTERITHIDTALADNAVSFQIAADAQHWTDEEIVTAGETIAAVGSVDIERRYELAIDPNAVAYLGVVFTQVVLPTLDGVLGAAIYDAMKRFLRPNGDKTIFHFEVELPDRKAMGYVETHDPEVLKRAMDSFDRLAAQQAELSVWDEDAERWDAS
jgi:hypothetical protein